jgi:hypothetical protein
MEPETVKKVETHSSANGFGMLVLIGLAFASGWMAGRSIQFSPGGVHSVASVRLEGAFAAVVLIFLAFALLGKLAIAKR